MGFRTLTPEGYLTQLKIAYRQVGFSKIHTHRGIFGEKLTDHFFTIIWVCWIHFSCMSPSTVLPSASKWQNTKWPPNLWCYLLFLYIPPYKCQNKILARWITLFKLFVWLQNTIPCHVIIGYGRHLGIQDGWHGQIPFSCHVHCFNHTLLIRAPRIMYEDTFLAN